MHIHPLSVVSFAWETLAVFWLLGFAFMKPVVRAQDGPGRMLHIALALTGGILVGGVGVTHGWLVAPFVPATLTMQMIGAALTVAGCMFAIWARVALGRNWSGRVTVKADHKLIVKGPYSLARHPIYTGILLAVVGTAMALDHWRCLLGLVLIASAFAVKMRQEEQFMMETFPGSYPEYRKRVKALIPGVL